MITLTHSQEERTTVTRLFDALHDQHDDPDQARVDQGDGLTEEERCSFLTIDTDPTSEPCAHHVAGARTIEEIVFPACAHHSERGGILHREARRLMVLELVARQNTAATITDHAVDSDGDKVIFPRFCYGCGARIFTGNTPGVCADCAELPPLEMTGAQLVAEEQGDATAARAAGYFDDIDAEHHRRDLEIEHHDGSWRDR